MGTSFHEVTDGSRAATPLYVCGCALSYPTLCLLLTPYQRLAITKDPFIVYSSNILRSLLCGPCQVLSAAIAGYLI